MTEEELKQYLRLNLTIDSKTTYPQYGDSGHVEVQLKLADEVISYIFIDLPSEN